MKKDVWGLHVLAHQGMEWKKTTTKKSIWLYGFYYLYLTSTDHELPHLLDLLDTLVITKDKVM